MQTGFTLNEMNVLVPILIGVASTVIGLLARDIRNRLGQVEKKNQATMLALFHLFNCLQDCPPEAKKVLLDAMRD